MRLQLVDFEAGALVAGQKFYYLKNEAVLLELALVQYAMRPLIAEGYTPIITPDVARVEVLEGIGFIPRDPDPEKRQIYSLTDTDFCLSPRPKSRSAACTAITFSIGWICPGNTSVCRIVFAPKPATRPRYAQLYRVHQFTKVEMFVFCTPDQSEHTTRILAIEEKFFQGLGLPYHVIDTCTGDLGGPAYRKYDLEAWMPGAARRRVW